MKLEEKIKATEELTGNDYLYLEAENTIEDMEEGFGTSSKEGNYIFGEWSNEEHFIVSFFNDENQIIWNGKGGIPIKWLKGLGEIWGSDE